MTLEGDQHTATSSCSRSADDKPTQISRGRLPGQQPQGDSNGKVPTENRIKGNREVEVKEGDFCSEGTGDAAPRILRETVAVFK
jgi:hypothetical protein